jgi:ricin-type beta-trefoil lectin protein
MTDRPDDVTERIDPVLVRPYVNTGPGEPSQPDDRPEDLPEDQQPEDEQPTAIQPAVVLPPLPEPAEAKSYAMHWALRLLVLVIGVAVALAIVAYFVRGTGSHDDARRGPSASLPAVGPAAPIVGTEPSTSARPSVSASHSTSPSPSASLSRSPTVKRSVSRAPASATLAPPPASDRTGRVGAASGRCLALGGLLGIDGSPIETTSCSGGTSQKFTLTADGTLQVASRCAVTSDDGSVRSDGCGGAGDGGQWRAGPNGSLVNPSSGLCLTDPGRSGATTQVATCTGDDSQRWALP